MLDAERRLKGTNRRLTGDLAGRGGGDAAVRRAPNRSGACRAGVSWSNRWSASLAPCRTPTTDPPRLYVVTRNAQAVDAGDELNLDQAGLRGLLRVIGSEQPALRPTQIDVDARTTADALAHEILSGLRRGRDGLA